ncbi:hypothetical protein CY34DRAFT_810064 [Suillus luteus UH-Slu-Lm8-n1]|uniref:Uncharacterized protein n=1 Tax=Suillus luteus UH-Slu-Lm8-n1 TaxID=930992 RepID=A0A0D0A7Y6_9AGAM|nr:hypothetical protein CY34DRAFT_810064 [Suillus luteus UH-Slu-Lm8-n1]
MTGGAISSRRESYSSPGTASIDSASFGEVLQTFRTSCDFRSLRHTVTSSSDIA